MRKDEKYTANIISYEAPMLSNTNYDSNKSCSKNLKKKGKKRGNSHKNLLQH